jgi:hypothetical protein
LLRLWCGDGVVVADSSIDLPDGLFSHPVRAGDALREKTNLPRRINLFLPVQSRLQKYFWFSETQIKLYPSLSHPTEGRIMIVTNAGWDAVDADAPITNGTEADGEVVWS